MQKLTDEHVKLIDELLQAQGNRDPRGLSDSVPPGHGSTLMPRVRDARSCSCGRRAARASRGCPRSHRTRRDHHGRQRPLGPPARPARDRRPPRRGAGAATHRRGRDRSRRRLAVGVRVLDRELDAAARRGARPARPARRDDPSRVPGPRRAGRARALRRPARPLLDDAAPTDARTRGRDGVERGARPVRLLRLRRAGRARRGGASPRARRHVAADEIDEEALRGAAVRAAAAGSRPRHPLLRRAAASRTSCCSDRLRRARLLGRALAGLRP